MLNDPRSHGLWEQTAPDAPPTAPLSADVRADVVVVGAGYTGLSAALHLAQAGARTVLLERVDIGFGGAGRNVGLVNAGMWVTPKTVEEELGADYGGRLLAQLGDAPALVFALIRQHAIVCETVTTGTLHCAVGQAGLREIAERAEQWQRLGAPVHLLSADETARKVGSTAYTGALLDLRAGTIQPLAYARGLAQAALDAGAQIHTGSPAVDVEAAAGGWKVRTPQGSVQADWVIAATDAYTTGLWPQLRAEQVALPYFNLATQPLSETLQSAILPERQGAWDTRQVLSSFRFDKTGRLVFGSVGALHGTGAPVHHAWAQRALKGLFPAIGEVRFESGWYGMIGMTADNLPRFHRLERNVIAFAGYNGRGIAPGTSFGRTLADLVLGRIAERDLPLPVTEPRAVSLRPARETFYACGAQLSHLVDARL